MSEMKKPGAGEIWIGHGGVKFEVLMNAEHYLTQEALVIYRECGEEAGFTGNLNSTIKRERENDLSNGASKKDRTAYVCTLEAFLEFMRPADKNNGAREKKELTPEAAAFREAVFSKGSAVGDTQTAGESENSISEEEIMQLFFEAEDTDGQIDVLKKNWQHITNRIVDNICVSLDVSVKEGSIDYRLTELVSIIRTKGRFEGGRSRLRKEQ